MAEPMRTGTTNPRFSYADDIGILGFGRTTAESTAAAQKEVDHLLDLAQENASHFDTENLEVVQFPPRHREAAVGLSVNGT